MPAEKKPEDKKAGLFSTPGSLFGAKTSGSLFEKSKNLFGGQKKEAESSNPFGGKSLFSGVGGQFKSGEGFIKSGGEEKSEEPAEAKPEFLAVSKDPYVKLFSKQVEKFQLRTGSKGTGLLSIERSKDDAERRFALLVFRNGVGKTLFTGQVIKDCKYVEVTNKPSKCQCKATCFVKEGEALKPDVCLLTFYRGDDRAEFYRQWDAALEFLG